jgi:hypothetical protein
MAGDGEESLVVKVAKAEAESGEAGRVSSKQGL